MPLSKQAILNRRAEAGIPYVSPNFGDGGWHPTPGCVRFTEEWEPLGDHILVAVDLEPEQTNGLIVKPNVAVNLERNSRTGRVLKVGPGKWIDGTWWKFSTPTPHWEWIPRYRQPMTLRIGQRVLIGQYADWESWDGSWEGRGANIVICQEADVRAILA